MKAISWEDPQQYTILHVFAGIDWALPLAADQLDYLQQTHLFKQVSLFRVRIVNKILKKIIHTLPVIGKTDIFK